MNSITKSVVAVRTGRLMRVATWIAMGAMSLALSGCADLSAPDAAHAYDAAMSSPLPGQWAAATDAAVFRPEWLGIDAQGELRALIDEAFEHNPDMRIAATRVEQARLQAELAGAKLWPTVNLGGRWSNSVISPDALSVSGVFAAASWEIDLWGVARAGANAGEARYRSVESDYVYARASLAAAVVKSWLLNIEATRALEMRDAIDQDAVRQHEIIVARVSIGKASTVELTQVDASVHAAHEQAVGARQAREAAQRSLELLLGRYPAARIEVAAPASLFDGTRLPGVPAGVPLGVLDRRPDLIASRNAFNAAFFDAQQAKAERLPNVMLTAGAGYLDTRATALKDQINNLVFPVGAKITWPLFDAGRRQTQYDIATVSQSEAAAQYARAIQRAMGEVENAMAAEREFSERADVLLERRDALARTADLTAIQREIGQADAYDWLTRRIAVEQAQLAFDQIRVASLASRVDLHLALGGRFGDERDGDE